MSFFNTRDWRILLQSVTGASCSALLFLATSAHGIVDSNLNDVSDLWEKHFNAGNLFTTFDPQADPDGDGWTNEIEAVSGTDPFDGNPPTGCIRPAITHVPAVYITGTSGNPEILTPEAVIITWPTLIGKKYTLLSSFDLAEGSWIPVDDEEPRIGTGATMGNGIPITQADGSIPPGIFLRVAISDIDTDDDGLSDHEEELFGSSRTSSDSDDDGLSDLAEAAHGTDPNDPDTDGDGISDAEEIADGTNPTNRDTDGDSRDDGDDADPKEILIDWPAVPESSFALVEVDVPMEAGAVTDINDRGEVLFHNGLWSGGTWIPLPEVEESGGYSPAGWDVETHGELFHYGTNYSAWVAFGTGDIILGEPSMWITVGAGDLDDEPFLALLTRGSSPITTVQAMRTGTESGLLRFRLLGMDDQNRLFATKFNPASYNPQSQTYQPQELWTLNTNLNKTGQLVLPAGFHVMSGKVSSAGWLAATLSNQARTVGKLAVWNPQGVLQSLPPGHGDGTYNDFSLTTIFGSSNVLANTRFPGAISEVLLPSATGGMTVIPSLDAKKITTFAGNGTAITSDDNLWRNGKLTASREICASYGALLDQDYTFTPIKANKHGTYLLKTGDPQGNIKTRVKLPMEVVSRDKFLAGSFRIPESYSNLEIEFGGHEDLGRYGNLLGDGATKIFDSVDKILGSPESPAEAQPADQKVWFVKDATDPQKIYFYTCFSTIGKVEIKLHLSSSGSAEPSLITHQLKAAPDFASIISYVDRWVKGTSFTGAGMETTWLAMNTSEIAGQLANETRACLIPFFDIIDQVTGLTPMVMGLCDGSRMGLHDDMEFCNLVVGGYATSRDWVQAQALLEIGRWKNDPATRVRQLKEILNGLCRKVVLPRLSAFKESCSTWEGFRKLAWKSWERAREAQRKIHVLPLDAVHFVATALTDWGDDFCTRMMTGAEKVAWDATPWNTNPLVTNDVAYQKMAYYTFGYTFGYLGEQVAVGVLTAGTTTLARILVQTDSILIGNLAPRVVAVLAMRSHFIKEALTSLNLMDGELRLAYERMMVSAARKPTTPLIKEIPVNLMESRMANPAFNRTTFNFKEWVKTAVKNGNVRKLIAKPGGEAIFAKRTSQLMHLLGDECDATTMKNFMKAAEERVVVVHADGTVDEFFEGFFRAFEGNPARMHDLDDAAKDIDAYTPEAKARLKQFLSDPDAGNLWKIDDPIWGPNGEPDIPHNYWTRGIIGELDLFYRKYKLLGFSHHPTQPGFDYDEALQGLVQAKTVRNPDGAVNAMQKAIDALASKASNSTTPLTLHIMKKPGTNSSALESALDIYKNANPNIRDRLQIIVEPYNIGRQ